MDVEIISVDGEDTGDEEEGEVGEIEAKDDNGDYDFEIFSQPENARNPQDDEEEQVPHPAVPITRKMTSFPEAYGTTIDLTAATEPALSFEQEYDALRRSARGFGFPYEAVSELLLRHPEHWWCRYPDAMAEMLPSVDDEDSSDAQNIPWEITTQDDTTSQTTGISIVWQQSNIQLSACKRCLRGYHIARERVLSRLLSDDESPEEIERFTAAILGKDKKRLRKSFSAVREILTVDVAKAGSAAASDSASLTLATDAALAFWEVFSYSQLLEDGGITDLFLEALGKVNSAGADIFSREEWNRHWPGVLTLLVHKDASVRAWAQSMARRPGKMNSKEYLEVLSPVIDRWVPVLEQGLVGRVEPVGTSERGEEERLHWSGLHVALQLLEPSAGRLLANGFQTLVDLTLQRFDDGPGQISLYLQVCGCLDALLSLLGASIWDYSSRQPSEVLEAFERQIGHGGDKASSFTRAGTGGGNRRPPNEAIQKKTLAMLPSLVSSARGDRSPCGGLNDGISGDVLYESTVAEMGERDNLRSDIGMVGVGNNGDAPSAGSFFLANSALSFVSREIASLSSAVSDVNQGASRRRKTTLAIALLEILEICYKNASSDGSAGGANDGDPSNPASWPWNASDGEGAANCARSGWWKPSWPVNSLPLWGPRLADIAGDRRRIASDVKTGSGGTEGGVLEVIDRATDLVKLVLRQHSGAAWRKALSALRPPSFGGDSVTQVFAKSEFGPEGDTEVLPLCGPLLEQICLELHSMDLTVRTHAAVFGAHGWLSLLPCGDSAITSARNIHGQEASRALAQLHSGMMSQFSKFFVPYVEGLITIVKTRGASVSPALRPEVAPYVFQVLLAPVPAAHAAVEELLLCSVSSGEGLRNLPKVKKGDIGSLLGRLPKDCARSCFLAVPQALGAMAAAGPHLSLKSWDPLFQAVGALGCAVLLPPISRSSDLDRRVGEDNLSGTGVPQSHGEESSGDTKRSQEETKESSHDEDDEEVWKALEAVWEFIFLQILPETLPALRAQHANRLEDAFRALFGSLESLWPLLTGRIPGCRRPRLTENVYRSRSLWLEPLLAWVTETWLPQSAREVVAGFVQRSLLPFLESASPESTAIDAGGTKADRSVNDESTADSVSPRKKTKHLRLVGGRLRAVEEECQENFDMGESGEKEQEVAMLLALRSAARAVTSITDSSPGEAVPDGPSEAGVVSRAPIPTSPFVRRAARPPHPVESQEPPSISGLGDGWSSMPWEQELDSRMPTMSSTSAGGSPLRSASTLFNRSTPAAQLGRRESSRRSSVSGKKRSTQLPAVQRPRHEEPRGRRAGIASDVGRSYSSQTSSTTDTRRRGEKNLSSRAEVDSWPDPTAARYHVSGASKSDIGMGSAQGGKSYVTAAEASAIRAREKELAASRPQGWVVERWREMQREQMQETRPSAAAGSTKGLKQVDRVGQAGVPGDEKRTSMNTQSNTIASASAAANAAFAEAARAAARRADSAEEGRIGHTSTAMIDYASLAEDSSMELHRLVLSSWTIPELRANPPKSARGGAGSQFAPEGQDKRLLSSLWLPKVPTRFQSVEQYVEIFRGLLLEEMFATLGAALRGEGSGRGDRRGSRGSRSSEVATLTVESFVENGKGGFSHVTMVATDGSSRESGRQDQGAGCPRFVNDDVLLLSVVKRPGKKSDMSHYSSTTSCLGIFEKEQRGTRRGPAGPQGGERASVRVKVFFRASTAGSTGGDGRCSAEKGIIPRKSAAAPSGHNSSGEEGSSMVAIMRAFRDPGTLVRLERVEGLSTSTREFVALEATPTRAYLLHHLLQATSNPRQVPVAAPSRRHGTSGSITNRPTKLGPPYTIDEASFMDACKRLSSVESSLLGVSAGGDGASENCSPFWRGEKDARAGSVEQDGGSRVSAIDRTVLTELLMRSLECLSSFRVTKELLTSHGRSAATRLKRLSKAKRWNRDVRDAAASLLRSWRGVVDLSGKNKSPNSRENVVQFHERGEDEGKGNIDSKGKEATPRGKDGAALPAKKSEKINETETEDRSRPNHQPTESSSGMADASSRSDLAKKDYCPTQQQQHLRSPERPSLVPALLWDRLCEEFNSSQLSAIWAAAASARESRQEASTVVGEKREVRGGMHPTGAAEKPVEKRTSMDSTSEAASSGQVDEVGTSRGRSRGGIVLLQGPPGTGKTRTILGLVSAILARREEKVGVGTGGGVGGGHSSGVGFGVGGRGMGTTMEVGVRQKRPALSNKWIAAKTHQRMLVCAPSNGAVDELTQRLASESGGAWDHRGKAFAPRVVRLGHPSEEAPDRVKAVSLEVMVEERVKLHAKSTEARNAEAKIREAYAQIEEAGRALRGGGAGGGEIAGVGSVENKRHQLTAYVRRLRAEVLVAKQRRRDALRGLDVERGRIRRSLISNAQIVCATLSACGSAPLVEAVSPSGKGFDTVIVDEACQATEPSTLIPISLGCIRLILVGDPRQLPATVISQRAARLNLETSLFERLESAGHPVHMLTVQYRMHPEIRAFPSARFYDGRLTDDPCVRGELDKARGDNQPSPRGATSRPGSTPRLLGPCFPPFLVVDVSSGSERRVGSSYQNTQEASFVAAFLSRLIVSGLRNGHGIKSTGSSGTAKSRMGEKERAGVVRVGVITPYRGQVPCIKQELGSSRPLRGGTEDGGVDVEVSTVDGFQGKEVDVVLFSCVRAPSSPNIGGVGRGGQGGIGFLADRRRMNVAITRARRSLVVLGNVRRLSSDTTWKALVDHAKREKKLVSDLVETRAGRSGHGVESGEALCAKLEAMSKAKSSFTRLKGGHQDAERNKQDSIVNPRNTETLPSRGTDAAGAVEERRVHPRGKIQGQRKVAGGDSDTSHQGVTSSRSVKARKFPLVGEDEVERDSARENLDRRRASDGDDGSSGQLKSLPSSSKVTASPPLEGKCGGKRDRRSAQRDDAVMEQVMGMSAGASSTEKNELDGSAIIPTKRTRVSRPDSRGGHVNVSEAKSCNTRAEKRSPTAAPVSEGLLAGLLNSLSATAGGIASGKDHEIRQGLRGGDDDRRKRAAAGSRFSNSRVTELSRPEVEASGPGPQDHRSRRVNSNAKARQAALGRFDDDCHKRRHDQTPGRGNAVPSASSRSDFRGSTSRGISHEKARSSSHHGRARQASSLRPSVGSGASVGSSRNHHNRGDMRQAAAGAGHQRPSAEGHERARPTKSLAARRGAIGGNRGGSSADSTKRDREKAGKGGDDSRTVVYDILKGIGDTWGGDRKKKKLR